MKTYSFLKKYTLYAIIAPLFKMMEAFFELLVPIVIANIIDIGIANGDKGYILKCFIYMFLFAAGGFGCTIIAQYFSAKTAANYTKDVKSALFKHIQSMSYSQLDQLGSSTLITRLTTDMNQMQSGLNLALRLLLRSPVIVFGAFLMALRISVRMSLIFITVITILLIIVFTIMLRSIPLFGNVNKRLDALLKQTRENLIGVRVIRAFNQQENEVNQFQNLNNQLTDASLTVGKLSALLNPVTYILINAAVIVLIYAGGIQVSIGSLSSGQVLALYNYMSQILVELIKLANLIIQINKALAASRRVETIFNIQIENNDSSFKDGLNDEEIISFNDVSFSYHKDALSSLNHISFTIHPKERVGVIGGTGSGKTTLIHLLSNFYQPTEGSILFKGRNISEYNNDYLREQIAIVPQKAVLFKGTIRSNMLWGNSNATDEEIKEALIAGQCGFVFENEGLDRIVEQNGSNFSGGQRQRLTIARALVGKKQLLILDDSASALDFATEAKLRKALSTLEYQPTIITISQRISSIASCDRILVLDDGNLVGNDTHENLLRNNAVYQEIYYSQNKKEEEDHE